MDRVKKITAKDIAIEAGVSEATVSYIINNRHDIKVAESTRKKVLQLCNLRQYAPSQLAKSLATGKNNIIGIQFNLLPISPSRNLLILRLIKDLQAALQLLGYDTLIMPAIADSGSLHLQHNIDGIVCIDLAEKQFYDLKENYFVPIISVDMLVADSLFFKVHNDISTILTLGKTLLESNSVNLIMEQYENKAFMDYVKSFFAADKLHIVESAAELNAFLNARKNEDFIIYDEFLALLCFATVPQKNCAIVCGGENNIIINGQIKQIIMPTAQKISSIISLISSAINRTTDTLHEITLSPLA